MSVLNGTVYPYSSYREHFCQHGGPEAATWKWADLVAMLSASRHTERGTLTLSTIGNAEGCELLPGAAISLQVVKPASSTRPHTHSWWHLFIVQAGSGTMYLGRAQEPTSLNRGDLVLVPAWCLHAITNLSNTDDLILMSLTNLPQQAALDNLRAHEPEDVTTSAPLSEQMTSPMPTIGQRHGQ